MQPFSQQRIKHDVNYFAWPPDVRFAHGLYHELTFDAVLAKERALLRVQRKEMAPLILDSVLSNAEYLASLRKLYDVYNGKDVAAGSALRHEIKHEGIRWVDVYSCGIMFACAQRYLQGTPPQKQALRELIRDCTKPFPMDRIASMATVLQRMQAILSMPNTASAYVPPRPLVRAP